MIEDLKTMLRDDFFSFYIQSFASAHPNVALIDDPFLHYLCHRYQALRPGDLLVVNQPPRTSKSWSAKAFAAWSLGNDPTMKVMLLSHNERLAEDHAYDLRGILRSGWFKKTFPWTRIAKDRSSLTDLRTTLGGGIFAASIKTSLGGFGTDLMLIDDPNRIEDWSSPERLDGVNTKFEGEILSRLNPRAKKKSNGIVVVLQHRIAENDLSGYLKRAGYPCVAFPLIATRTKTYAFGDESWTRPRGHVLMETYTKREIERALKLRAPPSFYFYQQAEGHNPAKPIRETDFCYADRRNIEGPFVLSIDAAQLDTASFNVAQLWDVSTRPIHLRKQFREQCGFATFEIAVKKLISKYRPAAVLVENAANGPALLSRLRLRFPQVNFVAIKPEGSKSERLDRHRKLISSGGISIQQTGPWVDAFVNEFVHHPDRGSDQVDATTQLLDYLETRPQLESPAIFAGPVGISASTLRPIVQTSWTDASGVRGIVIARSAPFFKKW